MNMILNHAALIGFIIATLAAVISGFFIRSCRMHGDALWRAQVHYGSTNSAARRWKEEKDLRQLKNRWMLATLFGWILFVGYITFVSASKQPV